MGTAERREREKQRRREEIIEAAERIFFSNGLDLATMDDVAEEAELSKGTLYLYFKSKEELYLAINERGLKIMEEMFRTAVDNEKTGIDKISAIGAAYFKFCQEEPHYFKSMVYYESREIDLSDENSCAKLCEEQGTRTLEIVAEAIQCGIEDGTIRKELHPFKTAVILWGQSSGVVQIYSLKGNHFQKKYNVLMDEIVRNSIDLMVQSIQA